MIADDDVVPDKPVAPKKPRKPRKPAAPKAPRKPRKKPAAAAWKFDSNTVMIGLLVVLIGLVALPYVRPFIAPKVPDVVPVPQPVNPPAPVVPAEVFGDVTAKVPAWFDLVAATDLAASRRGYLAGLDATLADFAKYDSAASVVSGLQENVTAQIGKTGWLDWGLFHLELLRELRVARTAGRLDETAKSHKAFFEAVRKGLTNG